MSTPIERLLYYEREHLRAFDLEAEQTYHLEMRRRLNRSLHLWGIVEGLELAEGPLDPDLPSQFYVGPGMAVDGLGREILLFAPYVLDEDALRDNRIQSAGTYPLWIAYRRAPGTPPAPGYRICDVKDQYTRWRESARLILSTAAGPDPEALPAAWEPLSDDPDKKPWWVRLGSVQVSSVSGSLQVTGVESEGRVYVGLRAQRVVPAVESKGLSLSNDTKLVAVKANLGVEENLVLGVEFPVDQTHIVPAPAGTFPLESGSAKVAGDLFLKGTLYSSKDGEWLALEEYMKRLVPEIQAGNLDIDPAEATNGTLSFTKTSQLLTKPSSALLVASLAGITWKGKTDLLAWWGDIPGSDPIEVSVSAGSPSKKAGTDNEFEFDVSWSVGPKTTPADPNDAVVAVEELHVSYLIVFFP